MSARDLAVTLASHFLAEGNYFSMPSSIGLGIAGLQPSTTQSSYIFGEEDAGFSGLSIQSVGYEHGNQNELVHIYVTRGSAGALKKLAREINGVKVQVNKMGEVKVRPEMASGAAHHGHLFERNGRIACGSSCAPSNENYSGTFGALVRDASGDMFVLSNNHVLAACNHVPVGMPIVAPSSQDSRPNRRAPSEIGRHHSIVELRSGEPTLVPCAEVDAAIARVSDVQTVSSWQGDSLSGFDTPRSTVLPMSGMRVKKFGRTTGLTLGTVEALIPTKTPLPYKTKNFSAVVWFKNVWTVRSDGADPFALAGDSGSLVVTEDGDMAIGLLFATSPGYGWIVPLANVLSELGDLELVSGHGT